MATPELKSDDMKRYIRTAILVILAAIFAYVIWYHYQLAPRGMQQRRSHRHQACRPRDQAELSPRQIRHRILPSLY